jgi:hypothetical protein
VRRGPFARTAVVGDRQHAELAVGERRRTPSRCRPIWRRLEAKAGIGTHGIGERITLIRGGAAATRNWTWASSQFSRDRLRYRRQDAAVFQFAFDLLELNGQDFRRKPIEVRKRELGKLLRWSAQIGVQLNEHIAEPSRSATLASSDWRASSQSVAARATDPAVRTTGSRLSPERARGEARGGRRLGQERTRE